MAEAPFRPRVLALCALLLRCAGVAVPAARRAEWTAEWWAELVWRDRDRRLRRHGPLDAAAGRALIACAAGCLPDALALGLERVRAGWMRRRAAAGRLGRTPVRSAAAVLVPAVPMVLGATALTTLGMLGSGVHDGRLIGATAALGGLAIILLAAAAHAAATALPAGRAVRDAAWFGSLLVALAAGPPATHRLAAAIGDVGQDPVAPPPAPAVVTAVVLLAALVAAAGRGAGARRRRRPRPALVPTAALVVAVLAAVGAAGFLQSRARIAAGDLGFEPEGLITLRVELPAAGAATPETVLGALRSIPGVRAASATTLAPLSRRGNEVVRLEDPIGGGDPFPAVARGVASDYFAALGLRGNAAPAAGGVLINRALARRLDASLPAGRRLAVEGAGVVVEAVVPDLQHFDPEDPMAPVVYYPLRASVRSFDVLVRAAPGGEVSAIAEERLRAAVPGAAVSEAAPMSELLRRRLVWRSLAAAVLGLVALCCAALGALLAMPAPATARAVLEPPADAARP